MQINLNPVREELEVRLDSTDRVTPKVVQRLMRESSIEFRTRDPKGRWTVSSQFIQGLERSLSAFDAVWDPRSDERLRNIRQDRLANDIADGLFVDSKPELLWADELGLDLYPEQREAAELMSAPMVRRFALFWEMGTGKTGAMIACGHELLSRGIVKSVMVVVERPIAINDPWMKELRSWLPHDKFVGRVVTATGSKRDRLRAYDVDTQWLIIPYDNLWRDEYAICRWAERNESVERPVVIFDESDYTKNADAKRSRGAMTVRRECGRCWISSGRPAPNSPSDYEHQLSLMVGYPVNLDLTGDRERDALVVIHALEKGVYYLQRENPRKMPEVTTPIYVTLSKPQRQEYDRIAGELISELETMDDVTYSRKFAHVMAKRAQLLRLCSDPGHESLPSPIFDDPAKWRLLDELLGEILLDPSEKAVIWTRYRATAVAIQQRYSSEYNAALMIGGGEGSPEDLAKPSCRVLVSTIQIGASSINLTSARNAIYESLDDVSRSFVQSMARINRTGQTKECRYWFLVAKDTVEEDLFDNTIAKMQVSGSVLDEIGKPGRALMIETLKRRLAITV